MQSRVPDFQPTNGGLSNPYRGLGNYNGPGMAGGNNYGPGDRNFMGQGRPPQPYPAASIPMSAPTNIGGQAATQQASPYTLGASPGFPGTAVSNAPQAPMPTVSQTTTNPMSAMGYNPNFAKGGLVNAAHQLRDAGRYGDSDLIHVNPSEREAMRYMFGPETRNPETGLPEHFVQFLPALLAAGKMFLGSKIGSTVATTAAAALTSKALKGKKKSGSGGGSTTSNTPMIPGVLGAKDTLKYNKAPREQKAYDFDPFTYGQKGGQRTFFKPYNPMESAAKAPEPAPMAAPMAEPMADYPAPEYKQGGMAEDYDKDDLTDHLVAYSRGGGHQGPGHVRGIGSGQEDKIPAWLSDGEYVWSAQDVADLGDGSTNEGVRRLDKMRKMVRAQAGRKNVKSIAKPQKGIDQMLKAVGGEV